MHPWVPPSVHQLGVHPKPQAAGESYRPKHAQRVVEEGLAGREGGADESQAEVGGALAGVVFYCAGVHIVEQGVDSKVSGGERERGEAERKRGRVKGRETERVRGVCAPREGARQRD